jgi:hypothetical protein
VDAHRQLVERDARLLDQPAITELQALLKERSAWAEGLAAELERCRAVAEERQKLVEERTAWAQRSVEELRALQKARFPMLLLLRKVIAKFR